MIKRCPFCLIFRLGCLLVLYSNAVVVPVTALTSEAQAQATPGNATQVVELAENIRLTIDTRKFDPGEHELTLCEQEWVCLVDGYPVFGAEGAVPSVQVTNIRLSLEGRSIGLEHKGMYNPWSPTEDDTHIRIVEDSPNGLRIRGEFSDGSAGYVAEWLVISGGSARVLIDCVECTDR